MKRKISASILLVLVLQIFTACSEQKIEKPGSDIRNTSGFEIKYAVIYPDNPVSDKPLTVRHTTSVDGQVVFHYRWYVDGGLVTENAGNVLDPEFFSKGSQIEVEVVPVVDGAEGAAYKAGPVTIKNTPPEMESVILPVGPVYPGDSISIIASSKDPDRNDEITYICQWEVNGEIVPDVEGPTFDTTGLKKRSLISVTAAPFDGEERGAPLKALMSLVVFNSDPSITSTPTSGLENGSYVYQVTAQDPDGDALTYKLLNAPQGMTMDRSSGLIRWELPKQIPDSRTVNVKLSVDDGDGGNAYQEFTLYVESSRQ